MPDYLNSFQTSLMSVWEYVYEHVPAIIAAIIVIFVGWVIASFVGRLIEQGLNSLSFVNKAGEALFGEAVSRAGLRVNVGKFIAVLVQIFVIVVFLVVAFDILNLSAIQEFFADVLDYIPRIVVAAIILVGSAFVANVVEKVVIGATKATKLTAAYFAGTIAKWSIWVIAILTALDQLRLETFFLEQLFGAVTFGVMIAIGLAFGFGGKDLAERALDKFFSDAKK